MRGAQGMWGVMSAQWAEHGPAVLKALAPLKPLFQNTDAREVLMPLRWKPAGGDPWGDLVGAWRASTSGASVSAINATHHSLQMRRLGSGEQYARTFQATWQLVPWLEPLYPFKESEGRFEGSPMSMWMAHYYWLPVLISGAYVVSIFSGKAVMSCLPALELKWPLFLWNLLLAAFSTVGAARTVPHLAATVYQHGWYYSICTNCGDTFGAGEVGLWACLFILSKIPELVDTVFIVLRKKPLILLHWYHHWSVLLYCWQSYATQSSAGIWFIAMNYSVHSIMYTYYALASVGMWPRAIPSWIITILQLSQMVVGIIICVLTYHFQARLGRPCAINEVSFKTGVAMYFSYFLLFLQVLLQLLTKGKPKPKASKAKKDA